MNLTKEQLKEALILRDRRICVLKEAFGKLTKESKEAAQSITRLEIELNKYHRNRKRWWEFWKI